ncbi:hypothetical protein MZK49_05670 [Ensifer sesbaniae]|uniref:hypothetical protein n=1 Tax=Ensifer sesbaniae TaxID=1214071 RepID=UPI002000BFEB|nr:hypothetical protein [Ensifer sesbaniae]
MESIHNHADSRQVTRVVNQLVRQFDNTGSFNLANSATTTTVTDPNVKSTSTVFLVPRNANAAGSAWFVSSITNGSFVVGHASATTTRTFDYQVIGV